MILFANSDSTIWNRDQLIIDIARAMSAGQPVELNTIDEGPCAESLGLYTLLDSMCDQFNYPKDQVSLRTCNLAEQHPEYTIDIDPCMYYLNAARQHQLPAHAKQLKYHFGHFVGHSNKYRLALASYLNSNYGQLAQQTYHCNLQDDYHRPFIGLEDLMTEGYSVANIDSALELIRQSPKTIDNIDAYPILNPTTLNITKLYPEFFVELVSLTYFSGNTFYIDEKIWRPILMRTPFIVQGPQYFIQRLRVLGFKTFSDFWDEGYSEDPSDWQINEIKRVLDYIAQQPVEQLVKWTADMQCIVEHNYNRLLTLTKEELGAVCQK